MRVNPWLAIALLLAGCRGSAPATKAQDAPDARFEEVVRQVAAEYRRYGRVDDQARWAPWMCAMPRPSAARFSDSPDEDTHGRKMYFIFARDRVAYVAGGDQPVGQALVKESWRPEEADPSAGADGTDRAVRVMEEDLNGDPAVGSYDPYAERDGRLYHAAERYGLFIMTRVGDEDGTDVGWIYGTVSADGTVTSAGRVASCMECHRRAGDDRIFGLP